MILIVFIVDYFWCCCCCCCRSFVVLSTEFIGIIIVSPLCIQGWVLSLIKSTQKHIVLETKYKKKIKHSLKLTFVLYFDDMEKRHTRFRSVLLVWWVILLSAIHFVFYHSLELFLLKLIFNQAVHVSDTWSLWLMIKTQITLIIRIFMGPIYRKLSFK